MRGSGISLKPIKNQLPYNNKGNAGLFRSFDIDAAFKVNATLGLLGIKLCVAKQGRREIALIIIIIIIYIILFHFFLSLLVWFERALFFTIHEVKQK